MNSPALALAIIGIGAVVTVAGIGLSLRMARHDVRARRSTDRADAAVAVIVVGIVGAIFGAGDLAFLVLNTS